MMKTLQGKHLDTHIAAWEGLRDAEPATAGRGLVGGEYHLTGSGSETA